MKIKIDRIIQDSIFITSTSEFGDLRRYYEIGNSLIITRNGYDLKSLKYCIADANVGWDIAAPGLTIEDENIGQRRIKVTIYRPLHCQRYAKKLSEVLRSPPIY